MIFVNRFEYVELGEMGIFKLPSIMVWYVEDDIIVSNSSINWGMELCGGLYMVMRVNGSDLTWWKVHFKASECLKDKSILQASLRLFL